MCGIYFFGAHDDHRDLFLLIACGAKCADREGFCLNQPKAGKMEDQFSGVGISFFFGGYLFFSSSTLISPCSLSFSPFFPIFTPHNLRS